MTGRLAKNFRQRISFRPPEGEEEVIVKTIPKKKFADTGGSALILPAGALLLSAGLLLGRSVIRRVL